MASIDMPRITLSVNREAFSEISGNCMSPSPAWYVRASAH
jgi:hypothetical protein